MAIPQLKGSDAQRVQELSFQYRVGPLGQIGFVSVTELSDLPPLQRIERCRAFAAAARKNALRTEGHVRECYLLLAGSWDYLATDIEATIKRKDDAKKDGRSS